GDCGALIERRPSQAVGRSFMETQHRPVGIGSLRKAYPKLPYFRSASCPFRCPVTLTGGTAESYTGSTLGQRGVKPVAASFWSCFSTVLALGPVALLLVSCAAGREGAAAPSAQTPQRGGRAADLLPVDCLLPG